MPNQSVERLTSNAGPGNTTLRSISQKAPGLNESILLLAFVVTGAIVGLALQHNWPKIMRVGSASVGYFTVLVTATRSALPRAGEPAVIPYWPFCLAGAAAGLLSAVVRPTTILALIVTQVLGAALLGGVHWAALRCWARIMSRLEG